MVIIKKISHIYTALYTAALDKYCVVLALPELDAAFTARRVLLADHRDEPLLPVAEGPLRLVLPDERGGDSQIGRASAPILSYGITSSYCHSLRNNCSGGTFINM